MAFSVLLKLWLIITKRLLALLAVGLIIHFNGVSQGRKPYILAAKTNDIKVAYETKLTKQIIDNANLEERVLNEKLKNHNCVIDASIARQLSDDSTD